MKYLFYRFIAICTLILFLPVYAVYSFIRFFVVTLDLIITTSNTDYDSIANGTLNFSDVYNRNK